MNKFLLWIWYVSWFVSLLGVFSCGIFLALKFDIRLLCVGLYNLATMCLASHFISKIEEEKHDI